MVIALDIIFFFIFGMLGLKLTRRSDADAEVNEDQPKWWEEEVRKAELRKKIKELKSSYNKAK